MQIDNLLFVHFTGITARVELSREADGRPVAVVKPSGARERRIKYTGRFEDEYADFALASLTHKALTDLLKRGFVVRPPQEGASSRAARHTFWGATTTYTGSRRDARRNRSA